MNTKLSTTNCVSKQETSLLTTHISDLMVQQFSQTRVSGALHYTQPPSLHDEKAFLTYPSPYFEWWKSVVRYDPNAPQETPPPTPQPPKCHLDSIIGNGNIGFADAPVGGWSNLSLFPDGTYNFSGHLHDSGAGSYDDAVVWVAWSDAGTAFLFKHTGRLQGTFESGSRDDDWNDAGVNVVIANAWDNLCHGYHWHWDAGVNFDLGQLLNLAKGAVSTAASIIEIV